MKKIMVVDDAENIRYLVKTTLELKGYAVTSIASGEDALKTIKAEPYNLLILDIMMPGMDGWEVARKLRNDLKSKIPILMLTARSDDASKKLSEEVYKVNGYITKPFLRDDLIKEVVRIIGK